jgi:hypothetical protein
METLRSPDRFGCVQAQKGGFDRQVPVVVREAVRSELGTVSGVPSLNDAERVIAWLWVPPFSPKRPESGLRTV